MSERASTLGSGHDRRFAGFAAACAAVAVILNVVDTVASPETRRPGQLAVTALLVVAAGALLPDSRDAAVVLPLAGAVLALPAERGRPLLILLALAFGASMLG